MTSTAHDDDLLRDRLLTLIEKTKSAERLKAGGWWVGDVAGERRMRDDLVSGRVYWTNAHDHSRRGLESLDAGNRELALTYAWSATDFYVAALESRVRPADFAALGRSSERRGRPPKK